MENTDPILDAMFDGEDFDTEQSERRGPDPEYGKGRWPNAILREVESQAANDYGHSLMVKVDLRGDEGMPFTFFVDAPVKPVENGSPDTYEQHQKRYQVQLNKLKTIIHATGQWVTFNERGYKESTTWPKSLTDFGTEEAYDKLVNLFRQLTGRKIGLNVKIATFTRRDETTGYRKDVWGLDPREE